MTLETNARTIESIEIERHSIFVSFCFFCFALFSPSPTPYPIDMHWVHCIMIRNVKRNAKNASQSFPSCRLVPIPAGTMGGRSQIRQQLNIISSSLIIVVPFYTPGLTQCTIWTLFHLISFVKFEREQNKLISKLHVTQSVCSTQSHFHNVQPTNALNMNQQNVFQIQKGGRDGNAWKKSILFVSVKFSSRATNWTDQQQQRQQKNQMTIRSRIAQNDLYAFATLFIFCVCELSWAELRNKQPIHGRACTYNRISFIGIVLSTVVNCKHTSTRLCTYHPFCSLFSSRCNRISSAYAMPVYIDSCTSGGVNARQFHFNSY